MNTTTTRLAALAALLSVAAMTAPQAAVAAAAGKPAATKTAATAAKAGASAAPSPEYKRGKLLFIQCRACHELQADAPDKVGPNLYGIIGRKVAAREDFGYSPALRAATFSWDRATLERWIEKPSAVVPGNAMAFAGIADARDRAALLTYIAAETGAK